MADASTPRDPWDWLSPWKVELGDPRVKVRASECHGPRSTLDDPHSFKGDWLAGAGHRTCAHTFCGSVSLGRTTRVHVKRSVVENEYKTIPYKPKQAVKQQTCITSSRLVKVTSCDLMMSLPRKQTGRQSVHGRPKM
eukprot:3745244-Pleurochrysis_carterae.AAC.1